MGFYRYQVPPFPYTYRWREESEPAPDPNTVIIVYASEPGKTYYRQIGDEWDTLVSQPTWIQNVGS